MLSHFLDAKDYFGACHLKCLNIVTCVHIDSLSEGQPLLHAWISIANGSSFLLVTSFSGQTSFQVDCSTNVFALTPAFVYYTSVFLFTIPPFFCFCFFHCCFYTYSKPKLPVSEVIAFQSLSWNGLLQCQSSSWQRQVQELDKNTESNLCFEWVVYLSRWAAVYFHASFSACNNVVFLFYLLRRLLNLAITLQRNTACDANPIVMVATNNMHILF